MDQSVNQNPLLELLNCPAFFVQNGIITQVNRAAQQKLIVPGISIADYLGANLPAYQAFQGGSLYLSLQFQGGTCGAADG